MRYHISATLVAVLLCIAAPAATETWLASEGFSQSANPNGVWTYGYQPTLGGPLTAFNTAVSLIPGIWVWCSNSNVDLAGNVGKNTNSTAVDTAGMYFEPGQLQFHPGPNGEYAVVRWRASRAATVIVEARFSGQNYGAGTTADVHVLRNGISIYDGFIDGFGGGGSHASFGLSPVQSCSRIVNVAPMNAIDFVVGAGGNGFACDLTGIFASVSEVGDAYTVSTLAEIKSKSVDSLVTLTSPAVVTSASSTFTDGACYVEDPGRATGIKLIHQPGLPTLLKGDRVTFTGVLCIDTDGERFVSLTSIDSKTSGTTLKPLGINCATAGRLSGLDITGLLVTTCGWVKSIASDGSYVRVDDGSGIGVRVATSGLVTPLGKSFGTDQFVIITGLAGLARDGQVSVRELRPRSDTDIAVLNATMDDMSIARIWVRHNLGPSAESQPFSFTYNGQPSSTVLAGWTRNYATREISPEITELTTTYTDPATGLELRCVGTVYSDFPAVEWVLHFKNTSGANTPIIENIQALNADFGSGTPGAFKLYYADGSHAVPTDFQPREATLEGTLRLTSFGGRSSDGILPFFNLAKPGGSGVVMSIGWTGQWAASFTRGTSGVNVQAGMEITRFRLHPGEEVRSPSSLMLFWDGTDRRQGQNRFRRLLRAHYSPTPGGAPIDPPVCASPAIIFEQVTEPNMIQAINNLASHGTAVQYWWMDAGWYSSPNGQWVFTGTWDPDPVRFPNGMKPIADAAHAKGYKFLLWFEPERVMPNTWLYNNHPEWLLSPSSNMPAEVMYMYYDHFYLLDLANPSVMTWLKSKIGGMIGSVGIDCYRNDFNMYPLWYWRNNEPADRQGIKEIKYITALYEFWDWMLETYPNLTIDNCASGGRRIDFEMLRRSLPLWRSDHCWDATATQCMTYGLSQWIPMTGVGSDSLSTYECRSGMGSHYSLALDWVNSTSSSFWDAANNIIGQVNATKHLFSGDFYPLTSYSTADNSWMAWQYDRADIGEGIVQMFRRPNSTVYSMVYTLKGLAPTATYIVSYADIPGYTQTRTGSQLMQSGVSVTLSAGSSTYVTYRRAL